MKEILEFIFIGHGPWVFIGTILLIALIGEEICALIKTVMNGLGRIIHGEPKTIHNHIYPKPLEEKDGTPVRGSDKKVSRKA